MKPTKRLEKYIATGFKFILRNSDIESTAEQKSDIKEILSDYKVPDRYLSDFICLYEHIVNVYDLRNRPLWKEREDLYFTEMTNYYNYMIDLLGGRIKVNKIRIYGTEKFQNASIKRDLEIKLERWINSFLNPSKKHFQEKILPVQGAGPLEIEDSKTGPKKKKYFNLLNWLVKGIHQFLTNENILNKDVQKYKLIYALFQYAGIKEKNYSDYRDIQYIITGK